MLHPHPGTTSASVTPATTGSTDLSLFLFWTFLITVKESPSMITPCNPRSFPKITACKHATASAANPIPWSGGHHSAVIGLKASLPHLTLLRSFTKYMVPVLHSLFTPRTNIISNEPFSS
ncbi:1,4-alpha-glucan-branching enzyme [Gossypium arboreum]|uniref:1,4-alpha-glucan-branching enzyme n=1 Tax=Gossypium arboreum TaxID=29729 RepID=A0A0B0P1Z5_GOSAR|nr:1,4-alpha-glucan-branching enzyme [Gossypium arboreum]